MTKKTGYGSDEMYLSNSHSQFLYLNCLRCGTGSDSYSLWKQDHSVCCGVSVFTVCHRFISSSDVIHVFDCSNSICLL